MTWSNWSLVARRFRQRRAGFNLWHPFITCWTIVDHESLLSNHVPRTLTESTETMDSWLMDSSSFCSPKNNTSVFVGFTTIPMEASHAMCFESVEFASDWSAGIESAWQITKESSAYTTTSTPVSEIIDLKCSVKSFRSSQEKASKFFWPTLVCWRCARFFTLISQFRVNYWNNFIIINAYKVMVFLKH